MQVCFCDDHVPVSVPLSSVEAGIAESNEVGAKFFEHFCPLVRFNS
jgi:hypothetical protein